jgi:hypothetical protein
MKLYHNHKFSDPFSTFFLDISPLARSGKASSHENGVSLKKYSP